jgi:hypothetical protein
MNVVYFVVGLDQNKTFWRLGQWVMLRKSRWGLLWHNQNGVFTVSMEMGP